MDGLDQVSKSPKLSKSLKKKSTNKKLPLPIGNWTKLLKVLPCRFDETSILKLHSNLKAKKHLPQGYRMFKASKVAEVFLSAGATKKAFKESSSSCYVKSKVEASFTLHMHYDVAIQLNMASGLVDCSWCGCKAGEGGACKHVGACLWYLPDCKRDGRVFIPDSLACTAKARAWGVPNTQKNLSTIKFSELHFLKHTPGNCSEKLKERQVKQQSFSSLSNFGTLEDCDSMQKRMEKVCDRFKRGNRRVFLCDIQSENNFIPNVSVPVVVENPNVILESFAPQISLPVSLITLDDSLNELVTRTLAVTSSDLKITLVTAIRLECDTREQSNCSLWNSERTNRLTASQFGPICKRRKEINESFLKSIFKGTNLSNNRYVQEGLRNEKFATEKYKSIRPNTQTYSTGLCINPTLPMLGASPDRLVYEKDVGYGLLEIKTLAKCKEKGISIVEAIDSKEPTSKFLKKDENGIIDLDHTHNHYYQIQGQLGLTGLKWCDLIVDCGDSKPFCDRIKFDSNFFQKKILPSLLKFYAEHGIKYLEKLEKSKQ